MIERSRSVPVLLTDPDADLGGLKTYGSYRSGCGPATLEKGKKIYEKTAI
jgi:hypothetical protein